MSKVNKGKGERYDVGINWADVLADISASEEIASSSFTIEVGNITINDTTGTVGVLPAKSNTTTATKVWWTGGDRGTPFRIRNTITTNNSRVFEDWIEGTVTR